MHTWHDGYLWNPTHDLAVDVRIYELSELLKSVLDELFSFFNVNFISSSYTVYLIFLHSLLIFLCTFAVYFAWSIHSLIETIKSYIETTKTMGLQGLFQDVQEDCCNHGNLHIWRSQWGASFWFSIICFWISIFCRHTF